MLLLLAWLAANAWSAPAALEQLRAQAGLDPSGIPAVSAAPARKPRTPISPGAAAGKLCGGEGVVVVVDNFASGPIKPYIDVDGDLVPDVNHGDVVAALYKAAGRPTLDWDVEADPSLERLATIFNAVADQVETGALRVAAVNFSQVNYLRWEALNAELDLKPPVTLADLGARRDELGRTMAEYMLENDSPHYSDLSKAFERLERLRIPVFLAAGNRGPAYINTLGFMPAMVNVGALDRAGARAPFSAAGGLIDLWALGEHVFRRAGGGVDVNGDGRPDFGEAPLSGGTPFVARFEGKTVEEAVSATPSEADMPPYSRETPAGIQGLRDAMPDKLFRVEDLIVYFRLSADRARSLRSRGRYFDKTLQFGFTQDASGRVAYDPAGSGAPGQVLLMTGTSYSAPALCR